MKLSPSPALSRPPSSHLPLSEIASRVGHVPSLDGMRAVSILIVMASHLISGKLFPGGLGVLVFFVISGFLITRLILAERAATGKFSVGKFYLRRTVRLYPVIVVFCLALYIVANLKGSDLNWAEFLSVPFYYSNYYFQYERFGESGTRLPIEIFWSLSIEEHFYIFFPVLLIVLGFKPHRIAVAMVVAMIAALVLRAGVAYLHPGLLWTNVFYRRTEMRMDTIAAGVLMATLCEMPRGRRFLTGLSRPIPLGLAALAVVFSLLYRDQWFREVVRYSILNLAVVTMIAAILFSDRLRAAGAVLNTPILVWIGKLSYSLYVWHLFVKTYLWPPQSGAGLIMTFAGAFALAAASYYGVEKPFMGLRRRFDMHSAKRTAPRATPSGAAHTLP